MRYGGQQADTIERMSDARRAFYFRHLADLIQAENEANKPKGS